MPWLYMRLQHSWPCNEENDECLSGNLAALTKPLSESGPSCLVWAPSGTGNSRFQEVVRIDSRLSQYRPERTFRHVSWMIRKGCVAIRAGIKPDLMTAGGLPVELEAARLQFPRDLTISEPCPPSHSRRDDYCVVSSFTRSRQTRNAVTFAPGFDQFPRDVPRDLKCLSNRPSLRYQAGKLIRGRQEYAFRQFLNLNSNRQFHTIDPTAPKPKSSPSRYKR